MKSSLAINRRTAIQKIAGGIAVASLPRALEAADRPPKTGLGLVIYDCGLRRKWMQQQNPEFDLYEPLTFLKHCQSVGAGGMQAKVGHLDAAGVKQLRDFAEGNALFIEGIVSAPTDQSDLSRFEKEMRTSAEVGGRAVRTVIMPGRRYERFSSLEEFRKFERVGQRMAELATPIAEKYRVPLAIENHKDQRNDERIALLKHISSEFVGACVDTGNSVALLEDPIETVSLLAPWAKSVHLKDQAVQEYPDGFLLGDIPLGQGGFDLKRMVEILRKAQPKVRFSLELLTRDALKVPCLTDKYWATLPQVPGSDLARTLRFVRQQHAKALQQVTTLPLQKQVALEEENVRTSLQFARESLRL